MPTGQGPHVYATESTVVKEHPNTTLGDPDGPPMYVASLGCEVPTFVDPRHDLIPKKVRTTFRRLSYHIPFSMRGVYKPEWLPHEYAHHMGEAGEIRINFEGYVLCAATSVRSGGAQCGNLAVNRANVCRNHGGALHPADKKLSGETVVPGGLPQDRIDKLDRVQKFMQGLMELDELSDEEVTGGFIFNDAGQRISSAKVGVKLQQQMTRELHRRMNNYMQMKLPQMLERVADIAMSDIVEPETALKATIWMAERQIGKTPEVLVHASTGAPYEQIANFALEAGSREDYRKAVDSQRGQGAPLELGPSSGEVSGGGVYDEDGEPLDVFEVDDGEREPEEDAVESFLGESIGSGLVVVDGKVERRSGILGTDLQQELDSERNPNVIRNDSDEDSRAEDAANAVVDKIAKAKEVKAARERAKKRRYAARATGATSVNEMWWLPTFKPRMVMRKGSRVQEGWVCRLVCPDDQNERTLAKIAAES